MRYVFGKNDWTSIERSREKCYLLANGLGGFSSLSITGANARIDSSIMMASIKAPNKRYNLIANMYDSLITGKKTYELSSQEYLESSNNKTGFRYLDSFTYEYLPEWTFMVEGIQIIKTIVMVNGENTVAILYKIENPCNKKITLSVEPLMYFAPKGTTPLKKQTFKITPNNISSNGITLNYHTNGTIIEHETSCDDNIYYPLDDRDGRISYGYGIKNHTITYTSKTSEYLAIIYSMNDTYEKCNPISKTLQLIQEEKNRLLKLIEVSKLKDEVSKTLVISADKFVSYRDSTKCKTIIAGYPFFEDWGRDTMIAITGCTMATKRFDVTKSILRTFMQYCRKGLMPNLFPEGEDEPMYNTADAALLYINAVYEYFKASGDKEFVQECYETMEQIVQYYINGTDYNIKMDEDGLIIAGSGEDQVTWMDVRIENVLPTPRHGKPVEINAYWYNALKVMNCFTSLLNRKQEIGKKYIELANLVKKSFNEKFYDERMKCLKDVVSGEKQDEKIRCNQIWALSMPFTIIDSKKAENILNTVYEKLYTNCGLRTLGLEDKEFHPRYIGKQFERDMAYHQGTVWVFPLGAYYLAYLHHHPDKKQAIETIKRQLEPIKAWLREGCIGQLPEIYDGQYQTESRGCFAQAWSVGELLRVYSKIEEYEDAFCKILL